MTQQNLDNINVAAFDEMPSPQAIHARLPITVDAEATVSNGRDTIRRILDGEDDRLFVVVGPCSIHDPKAALDYARRLKALADDVADTLFIAQLRPEPGRVLLCEQVETCTRNRGHTNEDEQALEQGVEFAREPRIFTT
ncbi:MAG TPA: 3-deoxy-7-phosphoheptulonate synthase, partial [Rhodocyclaceae bacterium]